MIPRNVFITGATGYIGRVLIPRLFERGHHVRALVRRGSEQKLLILLFRITAQTGDFVKAIMQSGQ